jgi:hypothetical protein
MISKAQLTEEETQIFGERAAIREFDGNQTKDIAEKGALEDIEKIRLRRSQQRGVI